MLGLLGLGTARRDSGGVSCERMGTGWEGRWTYIFDHAEPVALAKDAGFVGDAMFEFVGLAVEVVGDEAVGFEGVVWLGCVGGFG